MELCVHYFVAAHLYKLKSNSGSIFIAVMEEGKQHVTEEAVLDCVTNREIVMFSAELSHVDVLSPVFCNQRTILPPSLRCNQ